MLPFQKILFPVDYSDPCEAIVPYVKDVIQHFSASLTVLHAFGPQSVPYDLALADPDALQKTQAMEEDRLREFVATAFPGVHAECLARLGEPGTVIHKTVEHQGADVVMLATHGFGPVRRFLLGSVTTKVLHDVSAAVWTSVGSLVEEYVPRVPYQSILCAVDQTEESEVVLRAAAALACSYKASLHLLHIVETPMAAIEIDFTLYRKDLMDRADFELRELKGKLGIEAPHVVLDATMPNGIRQEAIRRKADLIVTGRGHAQLTFSGLWSRLYPTIRESPCPVLSV